MYNKGYVFSETRFVQENCQTNGICARERKQGLQIAMGSDSLSLMVSSY